MNTWIRTEIRSVRYTALSAALWIGLAGGATAGPGDLGAQRVAKLRTALDKGRSFLLGKQQSDGSWLHHPAITSMAVISLLQAPGEPAEPAPTAIDRGLDFVRSFAKPDGSIWSKEAGAYPNYSTAISLMALSAANRPRDAEAIRRAREFLLSPDSQFIQVSKDDPAYGGIGYGKRLRPDLSNTQWALEAIRFTDYLDREPFVKGPRKAARTKLAWKRALTFLTRCQNLAETNRAGWVMSDQDNRGGFIYFPGSTDRGLPPESKAGEVEVDGRKGLRSYGSMTYAGLKSMVYAKLSRNDVRVQAALDYIRRHFTFDENPGLGAQGLYYYLHTCAKALHAYGDETITDARGRPRIWRRELADKLLAEQRPDGSWQNAESARWMESIPELATTYAMMALEVVAGMEIVPAAK